MNKWRPIVIDGVETLELKIRNIDGDGVLFTQAGQMIGHQIASEGHYYHVGHGPDRVKYYRATFRVTGMPSDVPHGAK